MSGKGKKTSKEKQIALPKKKKMDKATGTDNVNSSVISNSTTYKKGVKLRFLDFSSGKEEQMKGAK